MHRVLIITGAGAFAALFANSPSAIAIDAGVSAGVGGVSAGASASAGTGGVSASAGVSGPGGGADASTGVGSEGGGVGASVGASGDVGGASASATAGATAGGTDSASGGTGGSGPGGGAVGSSPESGGTSAAAAGIAAPAALSADPQAVQQAVQQESRVQQIAIPPELLPSEAGAGGSRQQTSGPLDITPSAPAEAPMQVVPGTPDAVAGACRDWIVQGAMPYDPVRVDVASAGSPAPSEQDMTIAPLMVRIVYARESGHEVRQATVSCHLDGSGAVVALT